MKLALHIMEKDVRHLWREIAAYGLAILAYAWTETRMANEAILELLLGVTAMYVIVRMVHAESLVAPNSFWVTRPYVWWQLLAAKLLFIITVVATPVLIVRAGLLLVEGFPLMASLPGLLWSTVQFLALACVTAALAAVTADLARFVLSMLILVELGLAANQMLLAPSWLLPRLNELPPGVEWVRSVILVLMIPAIAVPLLCLQYRYRSKTAGRAIAVSGLVLGVAVYWSVPLSLAMSVQSWITPETPDSASLEVNVVRPAVPRRVTTTPGARLRFLVSGIPPDTNIMLDAVQATFHSAEESLTTETLEIGSRLSGPDAVLIDAVFHDHPFFDHYRSDTLQVHATVFGTLFGDSRGEAAVLGNNPVSVDGGMIRCFMTSEIALFCQSPFGWPSRLLSATFRTGTVSLDRNISYAPFPATLGLNLIEQRMLTPPPRATREAVLLVKEPVGHFRRDVMISDLQLSPPPMVR